MSLIHRYLFKKSFKSFAFATIFLVFFILIVRIFSILENYSSVNLSELLYIGVYFLPYTLSYAIPIALLISLSLVFTRLSLDNEITALRASGISIFQIFKPILFLAILCSIASFYINFYQLPKNKEKIIDNLNLVKKQLSNMSKGKYTPLTNNTFFYFKEKKNNFFYSIDLIILDSQKNIKARVIAKKALLKRKNNEFILQLFNSTSITYNQGEENIRSSMLKNSYSFKINTDLKNFKSISKVQSNKVLEWKTLLIKMKKELQKKQKNPQSFITTSYELNKRFGLSLLPLVFAFIIVPLSIFNKRSKKKSSLPNCLFILMIYFSFITIAKEIRYEFNYHPEIFVLLPNVLMLIISYIFIRKKFDI